ncbi:hypothetical protein EBT16_00130 [bacterium]|nr:hypothetical protein [bacterium]
MEFKKYLESEQKKDVKSTLEKIPKSHADLVRDYEIVFQPSNTLEGDDRHIGLIDEKNKRITIASPWNYGREYTLLHEIGHAVWKFILNSKKKSEWKDLLKKERKKNKKNLTQDDEEIFCMTYAQIHAKNKIEKYNNKTLMDFVSNI